MPTDSGKSTTSYMKINKSKSINLSFIYFQNIRTITITILLFVSSYFQNPIVSIFSIILLTLLSFENYSILIGLFIGVSIIPDFFIINLLVYKDTLNTILSILIILIFIMNIKMISIKRKQPLILWLFLWFAPIVSILKGETALVLTFILNLIVMFILYGIHINSKVIYNTLQYYTFTITWLIFVSLWINPVIPNINFVNRLTIVETVNPNRLGLALAIYGVILLFSFYYEKNKITKFVSLTSYLAVLFSILLTGSRNSLLALVVVSLIVWLKSSIVAKGMVKTFKSLVVGIASISILQFFVKWIPEFDRFSLNSVIEDQGSGRFENNIFMLKNVIPENLLFGIGLGGQENYISQFALGKLDTAHNLVISTLTDMGLLGSVPLFIMIVILLKCGIYILITVNIENLYVYLLLCLLILGLGETIYTERTFWIIIGLTFNVYYLKKSNKESLI